MTLLLLSIMELLSLDEFILFQDPWRTTRFHLTNHVIASNLFGKQSVEILAYYIDINRSRIMQVGWAKMGVIKHLFL